MFVIWLTSISSVVLISRFKKGKKNIILFLNSLAIGTLLADALIHVIPQALGIHTHNEDDDHDHHADHSAEIPVNIHWKMTAILGTMFILMLLDCFGQSSHGHSHEETESCYDKKENNQIQLESLNIDTRQKILVAPQSKTLDLTIKSKKFIKLLKGTGFIVFLANLVHKCADGLVIGAGESLFDYWSLVAQNNFFSL